MIDFLTLVIIGAAILQPTAEKKAIALIFASLTFAHNTFMYVFDGFMYYGSDALFYLLVILIVGGMDSRTKLAVDIQKISLAAIFLDYFGWLIWTLYIPPTGYNVAFMALYAWTIIILLKGEPENVGSHAMGARFHFLHPNAYSRHTINNHH